MNFYKEIEDEILTMKIAKSNRSGSKGTKLYKPLLILSMLDFYADQGDETMAFNNPTPVENLVDFFTIYLENELIKEKTYNDKSNIFKRKNILRIIRDQPLYYIRRTGTGAPSKIFLNDLQNNQKEKPRKISEMARSFKIRVPDGLDLEKLCNIIRSACYKKIVKETGLLIQDSIVTDLGKEESQSIYYRPGQGQYRRKLLEKYKCKCAFCNFDVEHTLIASHAKPWRSCDHVSEKLSEDNGFLLCATHDKMFDKGYISINIYNRLFEFSSQLTPAELQSCKKSLPDIQLHGVLNDEMKSYLKYHAEKVFRG